MMKNQTMKITIHTPKIVLTSRMKKLLSGVLLASALFSIGFGGYAYFQWQETQELLKDPAKREQEEFKATVQLISSLIKLPQDETPTLATVSEADRLKNMTFFKDAQNGDKVLMYIKNKKAYLYRPSDKILVEVATINISDQAASNPTTQNVLGAQQQQGSADKLPGLEKSATLTIRNGTTTTNLASTTRERLGSDKYLQITATEDAARTDYPQTIVVVLNEAFEEHGKELAKKYGVTPVIAPPDGEVVPKTDLLLILGQR